MAMYHKWWDNSWSNFEAQGGILTSAPGCDAQKGQHQIDVVTAGTDTRPYVKSWHDAWGQWEGLDGQCA